MCETKYVVINGVDTMCFSPAIEHSSVAKGLKATSAGFFKVSVEEDELVVHCTGESNSLGGLSHKKSDEELIKSLLQSSNYAMFDRIKFIIAKEELLPEELKNSSSGLVKVSTSAGQVVVDCTGDCNPRDQKLIKCFLTV